MKKKILSIALVISILVMCTCETFAWSRTEHDLAMRRVLFGITDAYYKNLEKDSRQKEYVEALQYASYLCLDYYNGSNSNIKSGGDKALNALRELGVKNLPNNLTDTKEKNGINYSANSITHRRYTHKGWDYDYSNEGLSEDKGNWDCRKQILQNTVRTIFESQNLSSSFLSFVRRISGKKDDVELQIDTKCNSLAAVIYYIHVLGDQIDTENYEEEFTAIPFIVMNGKGNTCIVDELEKHFSLLFESQINSSEYKILMSEMKKYKKRAEILYDVSVTPGGLSNFENYEKYRLNCEKEFLDMLEQRIPKLLEKEEFFYKVFYAS